MQNNSSMSFDENDSFDYKRMFYKFISNWMWFLASIFLFLLAAYLYIKYTAPTYVVRAKVLIADERRGGGGVQSQLLSEIGGSGSSGVENESEVLKTGYLMQQVVKDMSLNVVYFRKGTILDMEMYQSPLKIQILNPVDTIRSTSIDIAIVNQKQFNLKVEKLDTLLSFDKAVVIPNIGTVMFQANSVVYPGAAYIVSVTSMDNAVQALRSNMEIAVTNKLVSIIDLSITHAVPKKGEDILRTLINTYVETNIRDKNRVADSTLTFIKNRLTYLGVELGDLEGNIQGFKQKNNVAEISEQSRLMVENTSSLVSDLAKAETQLSVLKSLQQYLSQDNNGKRVLPSSLVISDPGFSALVQKYNSLLLERDKLLLGVTENNPIVENIDIQIMNVRNDMLASLSSSLTSVNITRTNVLKQIKAVEGQIREVPETERNFLDLARQQKIKQDLYIYLMQKSEEAAISKTYNVANSKVIDPPKAEVKSVSPKKMIIYGIAFMLALLLPAGTIYVLFLLNNRVESKEDITIKTEVPILGEISHNLDPEALAVANNTRSAMSEQFRALRTNLSFYLKNEEQKVILLTSSMSGEGKSFVSINLGNILALSGKKVLLMELDLRKPGLSSKLKIDSLNGYTDYMIKADVNPLSLVKPLKHINENLFILSSGPKPPNPAEMLMDVKTKELVFLMKAQFDYIIIDAPPIGLVTDAQLMADYSDICLYLVRQKFTFKDQINIIKQLHEEKKMKQIGIIVNDIVANKGYGYGYGYGYGSYGDN